MPLKALGEFIRKHVFSNFTAKLMALAMAVGLWLYAYISSYTESDVEIPVHITWAKAGPLRLPMKRHGKTCMVKVTLSYPRRFEDQFKQELSAGKTYIDCNVAPTR